MLLTHSVFVIVSSVYVVIIFVLIPTVVFAVGLMMSGCQPVLIRHRVAYVFWSAVCVVRSNNSWPFNRGILTHSNKHSDSSKLEHISHTLTYFSDSSCIFFREILVGGSVPMLWFKLIRPSEEVPSQRQRAREETGGQPAGSDKLRSSADNSGLQNWQILPALIRSNQNRESGRAERSAERRRNVRRRRQENWNGRRTEERQITIISVSWAKINNKDKKITNLKVRLSIFSSPTRVLCRI